MTDKILEKISQEVHNGIDTEPKALYLLAEIRKFIDGYSGDVKNKYPNLYFYCNWVLHFEMDRTPAQKILERFEINLADTKNLKEISRNFKRSEKNFYLFEDLKKELTNFFKENSIQANFLKKDSEWSEFKKLLFAILKDSPLVNKNGKIYKFSYEGGEDDQIQLRVHVRELLTKERGSFKVTVKKKID